MDNPRVLIIDDEDIVRVSCSRSLSTKGYKVKSANSGVEGLKILARERFDLVLTDLMMPDIDGIEVLQKIKQEWPDTEIIIITGYGTVGSAVQAMKYGAFDYLEKPFNPDNLLLTVEKALERKRILLESFLMHEMPSLYEMEHIIGKSLQMQRVFQAIAAVAPTDSTTLIIGESGTGKELVARAVHYNSMRKAQAFVVVDCGTIPETLIESELFGYTKGAFTGAVENRDGLFKQANGGSIFFDEIGNLPLPVQAKLLRVIQEREFRPIGSQRPIRVDVRFIAATNKDLKVAIEEGSFREDLFYRLNIFPINLPALKDRKDDIPLLSYHFLNKFKKDQGKEVTRISAEAMKTLMANDWPGNVRQLENTIERAVILCEGNTLRPDYLSFLDQRVSDSDEVPKTSDELRELKKDLRSKSIEDIEKAFVLDALRRNSWNITKAAADVGMQRTNFHTLLKKYNILKGQ